jgi:hypothetical protein
MAMISFQIHAAAGNSLCFGAPQNGLDGGRRREQVKWA